jgi:hypothetical protein
LRRKRSSPQLTPAKGLSPAVSVLTVAAALVSGCGDGSSAPQPVRQVTWSETAGYSGGPRPGGTAIETAYEWFRAVNAHNCQNYVSFFVPTNSSYNCKEDNPVSDPGPVSRVKCHLTNEASVRDTTIWCTWYQTANSAGVAFWDGGTGWGGGKFWTMDLSLSPHNTWLIYNYGAA